MQMENVQILGFESTIDSVGETLDKIDSIKKDGEIIQLLNADSIVSENHIIHGVNQAFLAFERGDRTIDQMVQAARSGKQNIVEGNADAETSIEMGIKLINVAKASLKELLTDYEDYLRVNGYEQWSEDSDKFIAMRKLGVEGSSQSILDIAKSRPLDTVANMAIILLKQEDYLLHKLLTSLSEQFLEEGGFKEKMHRMRVERRGR